MFKFFKKLLGIGNGPQETVKEILTPPNDKILITRIVAPVSNPDVIVTPVLREGKQRANVKKPNPNAKKPPAPPKPKAKSKPKAKRK